MPVDVVHVGHVGMAVFNRLVFVGMGVGFTRRLRVPVRMPMMDVVYMRV